MESSKADKEYIEREKDKYIKLSQALEVLDSCSCWWAHDRMEAIPAADVREVKWIPVTERLPELNVPCLVYNKSQPTMVGWRIDDKRFRIPGSYLPDHPTHWMPLPQPPKEE